MLPLLVTNDHNYVDYEWGEIDVANELQMMNNSRSQFLKMRNYELKSKVYIYVWIGIWLRHFNLQNDFATNDTICRDGWIKFYVSHTRMAPVVVDSVQRTKGEQTWNIQTKQTKRKL